MCQEVMAAVICHCVVCGLENYVEYDGFSTKCIITSYTATKKRPFEGFKTNNSNEQALSRYFLRRYQLAFSCDQSRHSTVELDQ